MKKKIIVLCTNFIVFWSFCCCWYFIQALYVEHQYKDLHFMISRFGSWIVFYVVELYIIRFNIKIYQKKKRQILEADNVNVDTQEDVVKENLIQVDL